ncbi:MULTISPECIES: hypothetical protein [Metallosphaera]|nr:MULTISPECIES: hypothetical protein [Metallosphaera]BBL47300.1 hypothetical protein MJ1HA_1401 [Metallosphaera sedula]
MMLFVTPPDRFRFQELGNLTFTVYFLRRFTGITVHLTLPG